MAAFQHKPRGSVVGSGNYVFRHYGDETAPMPVKGQIITMELGNATPPAGTNNTYRVLSVDGNIAFVMAMFDAYTSQKNTDSYLEKLNTDWYNSLNAVAKTAIVPKNITRYSYANDSSVYNVETHASYANYGTKTIVSDIGNKSVYVLGVEDVENYFDGIFSTSDIFMLFWNSTTAPQGRQSVWLVDNHSKNSDTFWSVSSSYGYVYSMYFKSIYALRPAFKIDLSKISWA